jgi:uncharacterized protein
MAEHVILIAGPMGAGKTTAIEALSEIPVVSTEAANTDRETANKATTTVALDYGEITLDGIDKIRLYGVPGQRRFDFMWRIIEERALGLILLINNDAKDPLGDLVNFISDFAGLQERGGVVIGVTRSDVAEWPPIEAYADKIREVYPHITAPVFTIDARCGDHMLLALTALLYSIESQNSVEMDLAS